MNENPYESGYIEPDAKNSLWILKWLLLPMWLFVAVFGAPCIIAIIAEDRYELNTESPLVCWAIVLCQVGWVVFLGIVIETFVTP